MSSKNRSRVVACAFRASLFLGLASPASAQDVFRVHDGDLNDLLRVVAPLEDVDFDSVPDIIVAASAVFGEVSVLSGATGDLLLGPVQGGFSDCYGCRDVSSAGDFDADGYPDVAIGNPSSQGTGDGEVIIISGRTGARIVTIPSPLGATQDQFGYDLAPIGDVNLDGYDDIIVSHFGGEAAFVCLGPNGAVLRSHPGPLTRHSVSGVGDVDGDGIPDYAAGFPQDSTTGIFAGRVDVYSGLDGSVVHQVYGTVWDHLGKAVAGVGDIDLDGTPDFAAGAPGEIEVNFGPTRGFVRVYSGADGSVLLHLDGPGPAPADWSNYGDELEGGGDINGDRVPDLVVGAPDSPGGEMHAISGATGTILWIVRPGPPPSGPGSYGTFIAMLGDLNGDGFSEFAHGDNSADYAANNAGRITIFSGARGDARRVCDTSPNSQGPGVTLSLVGPISVGNAELRLHAAGGPFGEPGVFFYGPTVASAPLGDGTLCVGGGSSGYFRIAPPVTFNGAHSAELVLDFGSAPLDNGPGAWSVGSAWILQLWYRDPNGPLGTGSNLSDAWRIVFTP